MAKIIWTRTDEAPLLASLSLRPIVSAFAATAGVEVEERDISLAGRILAQFPDYLPADQQVSDALAELGSLAQTPAANIIKLLKLSKASLVACHRGLQWADYVHSVISRKHTNDHQISPSFVSALVCAAFRFPSPPNV